MFKKIIAYVGICLCFVLCFGMFFIKPVNAEVGSKDEFENINLSYLPTSFTNLYQIGSDSGQKYILKIPLEFVEGPIYGNDNSYFSSSSTTITPQGGRFTCEIKSTYNTTSHDFIGSQYQYMLNQISRYYLNGSAGSTFELKWDSFVFPYATWNNSNFSIDNFNNYFSVLIIKGFDLDTNWPINLEFLPCDFYINYLENGVLHKKLVNLNINVIDEGDYFRLNILNDLYSTIMSLDSSLGFEKIGIVNCMVSDLTIRFGVFNYSLPSPLSQDNPVFILSSMIITDNPYPTEDTNGNPYFINYGMNYDERYFFNQYNFPSLTPTPLEPIDSASWLITSVGAFMNAELFPGFAIGGIFAVMVAFPLVIWFLKIVLGG